MVKALGKKIYRHLAQLRENVRGRGIINEHVRGTPSEALLKCPPYSLYEGPASD